MWSRRMTWWKPYRGVAIRCQCSTRTVFACSLDRFQFSASLGESHLGPQERTNSLQRLRLLVRVVLSMSVMTTVLEPFAFATNSVGETERFMQKVVAGCLSIEVPIDSDGHFGARHTSSVGCHWAFGGAAQSSSGGRLWGQPGVEAWPKQKRLIVLLYQYLLVHKSRFVF